MIKKINHFFFLNKVILNENFGFLDL